jgi:hypothetical protein
MSKLDAQRAMREANWAARQKAVQAPAPAPAPVPKRAAAGAEPADQGPAAAAPVGAAPPEPAATALCGHRAIGGNTCTRPAGHAEKNHRYK